MSVSRGTQIDRGVLDVAEQLGVARGDEVPQFDDPAAVVGLDRAVDLHLGEVGQVDDFLAPPRLVLGPGFEPRLDDHRVSLAPRGGSP